MEDIEVWPDAERGIYALLEDVELLGFVLKPSASPSRHSFEDKRLIVVQLETVNTREGDADRVQEVRLTVYGPSRYQATDLFEAILSYISGEDIETPPLHNWPGYYFDSIHRDRGPSSPPYPDNTISPAVGTVLCTARPMA